MATLTQFAASNDAILDALENPGTYKQAADDASDYVRLKLREQGFSRKIIEPKEVSPSDLDTQLWTDKPVKIYEKETDIHMPCSVGYGQTPIGFYIHASRFAVTPTMIISPRVSKHKWELRTHKYDVRQVFADNICKDMEAVEDRALLATANVLLGGAGVTMPGSGVAQYQQVPGGFSRAAVRYACFEVLQATPYNIPIETNLINNLTYSRHLNWRRDEAGGDFSEETLTKGWTQSRLFNQNWLVTIKRGLVGNNAQYLWGPTKFLGKSCLFTPPTMYVEMKHPQMYSFFVVEEIGTTLAHTGAIGRVDYLT